MKVKLRGKGENRKKAVPSRLRLQEDRVDPKGLARNPYGRVNAAKGETRKGPVHVRYRPDLTERVAVPGTCASTRMWIPRAVVRLPAAVLAS